MLELLIKFKVQYIEISGQRQRIFIHYSFRPVYMHISFMRLDAASVLCNSSTGVHTCKNFLRYCPRVRDWVSVVTLGGNYVRLSYTRSRLQLVFTNHSSTTWKFINSFDVLCVYWTIMKLKSCSSSFSLSIEIFCTVRRFYCYISHHTNVHLMCFSLCGIKR